MKTVANFFIEINQCSQQISMEASCVSLHSCRRVSVWKVEDDG